MHRDAHLSTLPRYLQKLWESQKWHQGPGKMACHGISDILCGLSPKKHDRRLVYGVQVLQKLEPFPPLPTPIIL